jgi:putative intracellular protease/amidase
MESKKALIVITSVSKFPTLNRPTGFWFTEVSHFYEVLTQSGWQVDFVSPRGGLVPIEPKSLDGLNMN